MSRMFTIDGKRMTTWNPFTGCNFRCSYCFARRLVEGRLKHLNRYRNGFRPTVHPDRFHPRFKLGEWVFVCDMGDIAFAQLDVWDAVQKTIALYPSTKFLLQSKAPSVFVHIDSSDNLYFGTTLETNRTQTSNALPTYWRYQNFLQVSPKHRFVSVEPIMDFDLDIFLTWLRDISPEIVQVGADNYRNHLPEPSWDKVQQLLTELRKFVPEVVEKEGLERLKK